MYKIVQKSQKEHKKIKPVLFVKIEIFQPGIGLPQMQISHPNPAVVLPLVPEEVAYQLAANIGEDSAGHLGLGVEQGRRKQGETPLGVVRPPDDTPNLRPVECGCAHRAGLYRYVDTAVREILPSKCISACRDSLHLSMSRNIA